jgi:predicted nucleotidyltransferase
VTGAPGQRLVRAVADLLGGLEESGARHMIIGGLAVIARGVVRHTDDADATLWAAGLDLSALLAALRRRGILGRIDDLEAFAAQSQVLLLVHEQTGVPMDVSLGWLPFEREALERAETISVAGVAIPIATAQDLIVYKTIAWRDRDRQDVEGLLRLHRSSVDLEYIRARVAEFAEAIEEPERLSQLDALVSRIDGEQ